MINVDQIQTKCSWSTKGLAYGVDSINRSSGVMYADYFYLDIHVRLQKESDNKTRMIVTSELIWEKPCLLKSKVETETSKEMRKYYEIFEKELLSEKSNPSKRKVFL